MVDAARVDAILKGLAQRQQAGISMHASKMEELDSQIAQMDQNLAAQTCNLLGMSKEAQQAQKEEMELKAEWEELSVELAAYQAENLALYISIEQCKQELTEAKDGETRLKQAFLHASSLLNSDIRNILVEQQASSFVDAQQGSSPDEGAKLRVMPSQAADDGSGSDSEED